MFLFLNKYFEIKEEIEIFWQILSKKFFSV